MLLEFDSYSYSSGLERIIFSTFSKTKIQFTSNFRLILFMIISQKKHKYKKELSEGFLKTTFTIEFGTNYIRNSIEFDIYKNVDIIIEVENHITLSALIKSGACDSIKQLKFIPLQL